MKDEKPDVSRQKLWRARTNNRDSMLSSQADISLIKRKHQSLLKYVSAFTFEKLKKCVCFDIEIFKNKTKTDQKCQVSKMRIWWQGSTMDGVCRHLLYTLREKRLQNGRFVLIKHHWDRNRVVVPKRFFRKLWLVLPVHKKIIKVAFCSNNKNNNQPETWKKNGMQKNPPVWLGFFSYCFGSLLLNPPLGSPNNPCCIRNSCLLSQCAATRRSASTWGGGLLGPLGLGSHHWKELETSSTQSRRVW